MRLIIDQSGGSPTKLVRNLMNVFFMPEVLAKSSTYGTKKHPALERDMVSVCIRKSNTFIISDHVT